MLNRFLKHDLGQQVIEKGETLKIHVHKTDKGSFATFNVYGSVGRDPFDDDDDQGDDASGGVATADEKQAADLRFIRELLEQFQKSEPT